MQDEISFGSVQGQADGGPIDKGRTDQRFLHISDAKTRDSPTVPSERNSKQARTQLMLYHRLLSGLVQPTSDLELNAKHLDFDVFWLRVGVDPYEVFSDGFCEQTGLSAYCITPEQQEPSVENWDGKETQLCLNTLVDVWKKYIHLLGISSVDPTLTLNYRRRTTSGRKKRRRTDKPQGQTMDSLEDKELDQAIFASLVQADHDDPALAHAIAESLRDAGATGDKTPEQTPLRSPSKRDAEPDSDEPDANSGKGVEEERSEEPELIGSASFVMDDAILDARLEKVLEWWHGIRPPEGVELEDTGRCQYVCLLLVVQRPADPLLCSSCEFSTSCEWREKKHNELLSKLPRTRDV